MFIVEKEMDFEGVKVWECSSHERVTQEDLGMILNDSGVKGLKN